MELEQAVAINLISVSHGVLLEFNFAKESLTGKNGWRMSGSVFHTPSQRHEGVKLLLSILLLCCL